MGASGPFASVPGPIPFDIAEAEVLFRELRRHPPACEAALRSALACVVPHASDRDAVVRASLGTVRETERLAALGYEHAYHNRYHVSETILAMAWLCALAVKHGTITREAAALGVLAMAGHDIAHDGSRCLDGRLEARSAGITRAIAVTAGLDAPSCALVHDLILASIPAGVQPSHFTASPGAPTNMLYRLAREADVFASLLPCLGWQLGFALRREWRAAGDPAADEVVSFTSRCRFLQAHSRHTEASDRIGLSAGVRRQLDAFRFIASQSGGTPSSASGAAVLDRIRPPHAASLYRAALAAVAPD